MKIVVLGAAGQLGRELCRVLPGEIVALTRADVDLTAASQLRGRLETIRPGFVINAAGFTHVDHAEAHPDQAFAVNALAPRALAEICGDLDATLIHFSTNYVFGLDLLRDSPYDEEDPPGPVNVYGASKLTGEYFLRGRCLRHFILRTCGLYGMPVPGAKRTNFVETMLNHAAAGTALRVVTDQFCTPTSARDLADGVVDLLDSQAYGTYHVTNAGACSWHEFAEAIFDIAGLAPSLTAIASAALPLPATRPRYSVLSNRRWINAGFRPLRHWREALAQHLATRGASPIPPGG